MRTLCFDFFLAWVITTLVLHGYASNAAVKQKIAEDLLRKGYDCIQKGDYGCAIADFTKAIELNPKIAQAYDFRGDAWAQKGDIGQACSDWRRACEIGACIAFDYMKKRGRCK